MGKADVQSGDTVVSADALWGYLVSVSALFVLRQVTGTPQLAIISLMLFLIVGLILLALVDEERAKEAKRSGAF